jgi:hypothetical protein
MCFKQLGEPEAAQQLLAKLRALCQKVPWAKDEETQAFLREAEALIDGGPPRP